jgi:anti-sigma regulatory factor (Ser/Thr protein kinase)
MLHTIELKFKPILSTVPEECAKIEDLLIEKGVSPECAYKARCIAHEVIVNAVRHGKIKDNNSEISLIIKQETDSLSLEFIDCGMEWQPNNDLIQKPDHYSTDEELYAPFGKGLRLIGSMCRSYELFRCNGKNHTSISVGLK